MVTQPKTATVVTVLRDGNFSVLKNVVEERVFERALLKAVLLLKPSGGIASYCDDIAVIQDSEFSCACAAYCCDSRSDSSVVQKRP